VISAEVAIADPAWREALPEAEALIQEAAHGIDAEGDAAVLLTDDAQVRDLNARFRDKNAPTNVLSFPAGPNPVGHLGDLALAFGVCESEARAQGKPLADHLRHLVVHGLLHLLGYDHEDEAEGDAMEALERSILSQMGVPDPYGPQIREDGLREDAGHDRLAAQS
jgi:probable rRNA maturation factor